MSVNNLFSHHTKFKVMRCESVRLELLEIQTYAKPKLFSNKDSIIWSNTNIFVLNKTSLCGLSDVISEGCATI